MQKDVIMDYLKNCMIRLAADPAAGLEPLEISAPGRETGNEMLAFLKPEAAESEPAWNLVLQKAEAFGYEPGLILVLSGAQMEKKGIPERHYGVINLISSRGGAALSAEARTRFKETWGIEPADADTIGSLEAMRRGWTFKEIDSAWTSADPARYGKPDGIVKLSGGAYCLKMEKSGGAVFLLNGFHPRQIRHFSGSPAAKVALFLLRRKKHGASWADMRRNFLGHTDPAKAAPESIRGILYRNAPAYKIRTGIDMSHNGIHGSAGPLEGMREIQIWLDIPLSSTIMGKKLLELGASPDEIQRLTENPVMTAGGKTAPLFDLTEEMDMEECLALLSDRRSVNGKQLLPTAGDTDC